jgi:integral membrane protein
MFKLIAYAEVTSYLLLLIVAVPLKYLANEPMGVKILGPIHGVLFVAYCFMIIRKSNAEAWTWKQTLWGLFAGILPLGPVKMARAGNVPGTL